MLRRVRRWIGKPLSVRQWSVPRTAIILLLGAVVFFVAINVAPRLYFLFGYHNIRRLLFDDLGLSEDVATLAAVVFSFLYAVLWVPLLKGVVRASVGRFNARKLLLALAGWIAVYGATPALRLVLGGSACFNQRTGEPLKWYSILHGGTIELVDSPGFDAQGTLRRPVTMRICGLQAQQRRGIRPRRLDDDVGELKLFDDLSGAPRVWYSRRPDGTLALFDAAGVDDQTMAVLEPIDRTVAKEVQAVARQRREEIRAQERLTMVRAYGASTYEPGTVVVGARAVRPGATAEAAAEGVQRAVFDQLRANRLAGDVLRPGVYQSGQFERLVGSDLDGLRSSGLLDVVRAILVITVEATCRSATQLEGAHTCTVSGTVTRIDRRGMAANHGWSETGAAATEAAAVLRAAEIAVRRHPEWLEGL